MVASGGLPASLSCDETKRKEHEISWLFKIHGKVASMHHFLQVK